MTTDRSRADPGVTVDITTTVGAFTVTADFTASAGITALFGPSGSGKSVTLATVAGLLRPDRGTIALGDSVVADPARGVHVPTQDRRLGMVFQHAGLLPHRSPLDNVAIAVRTGNRTRRRELAGSWLDRVHAGHLATTPTATLSGGEQQRIALARALAGQPRLLLLDEPFSALDQPTRRSLRQLVRDLVDAHDLTAIVVTHDLDDIAHLADRVVLYEPGSTTTSHDLEPDRPDELLRLLRLIT
ncbi:MAG: Molybdenum ABC transporter ATP-binding protein ModC [uncultured Acidimicrobiales bacterium]|uniref:Molybdenum ABC transporter ATP-binding protein ModC n=1 Tax=uncultured Acidimicrobiales bacterium TaxID=310071 RepID=A0A6J4HDX9_9ACTN|nr:MAG: Molybdenum ABC transporter ATP-binding protein ModC [uncultured Acidimicrobiales bacterium]